MYAAYKLNCVKRAAMLHKYSQNVFVFPTSDLVEVILYGVACNIMYLF